MTSVVVLGAMREIIGNGTLFDGGLFWRLGDRTKNWDFHFRKQFSCPFTRRLYWGGITYRVKHHDAQQKARQQKKNKNQQ